MFLVSSAHPDPNSENDLAAARPYLFTRNDPFDRSQPIRLVVDPLLSSREYMRFIRAFDVPRNAVALWYFGQNGFVLKSCGGVLFGIDLYLTNSCAGTFADQPFRLDRQLPIFVEPEDLDIDVFLTTHSHDDHADPATLKRLDAARIQVFVGPWDSLAVYRRCGLPESKLRLIHPGERMTLPDGTALTATFALPTDSTDLNHSGVLLEFANGIRFYNTGDTAYAERLASLLPENVDICTICINGGFHNLSPFHAAAIVKALTPAVVIPCHYDMMVNNVGDPDMFRIALDLVGASAKFHMMRYYEPWLYRPSSTTASNNRFNVASIHR